MNSSLEILKKYWGYDSFRANQEDIISAVISKKDTLAILPTGGGKSLCYQIPALYLSGVCIVVSPLVALMRDQIYQLKKRGIQATAIFSGMRKTEIDFELNKCVLGKVSFLYISPERLQNEAFRRRLQEISVSFLAVDEAHCISQWGYDFRPPYLQIQNIKEIFPNISVLALTASATPVVQKDIIEKLQLKNPSIFKSSFVRENIDIHCAQTEQKVERVFTLLKKIPGTILLYTNSRAKAASYAELFTKQGIPTSFYHAGLDAITRNKIQEQFTANKIRVLVATNAFGMGIDKADVRAVFHLDLPDSIENYYQEIGRAGRDGKRAFGILLYTPKDLADWELKHIEAPINEVEIKTTYQKLCEYYRIAYGSGQDASFEFNVDHFFEKTTLHKNTTLKAFKILTQAGYIHFSDAVFRPSRIHIYVAKAALYKYQVEHPTLDPLIKLLLRSYSNILESYTKIEESFLAKKLGVTEAKIKEALTFLDSSEILSYAPKTAEPFLTFLTPRLKSEELYIDNVFWKNQATQHLKRTEAFKNFLQTDSCRMQTISTYFGEEDTMPCGHCDHCKQHYKTFLEKNNISKIQENIIELLSKNPSTLHNLSNELQISTIYLVPILQALEDAEKIQKQPNGLLQLV